MENKKGLGDVVEDVIKKVTNNRIKACSGCQKRKAILNKFKLPYSNYKPKEKN
jgi:hypothetical protein